MDRREAGPIDAVHLFPELLDHLLRVLSDLTPEQWARPTACTGWSVSDVALHVLGDEIGLLSRKRDHFVPSLPAPPRDEDLVAYLNDLNERWVAAARRISPRLLCELLYTLGEQACAYFRSLDPQAMGGPVSWAGPEPAPVWLDIAREYSERWHHQQHIREAVGLPGLNEPRYLGPVLDTFARALPHTFRKVQAPEVTVITLAVDGAAGGSWSVSREGGRWTLWQGAPDHADAKVVIPQDVAWKLFTKGMAPEVAEGESSIAGSRALGLVVLEMVAIIA